MRKELGYYLSLKYPIQLTEIAENDGGGYLIGIPLLKGCITDGNTLIQALENLEDAKKEWFKYMLDNNLEIPEPMSEEEFSGKFTIRISKSLHKIMAEQSKKEGLSLNQYVSNSLAYIAGQKRELLVK